MSQYRVSEKNKARLIAYLASVDKEFHLVNRREYYDMDALTFDDILDLLLLHAGF